MGPDWLGSPQHFLGGLVLAVIVALIANPRIASPWVVTLLALGLTALAEIIVELVEYPLLYSSDPHVTAYYDTLADMADTLAGAAVGSALLLAFRSYRRSGH
jgi:hypothetical protein